jgi:tryptophan-rich sensory protein
MNTTSDHPEVKSRWEAGLSFVLAAFAAGAIGSAATLHSVKTWYPTLAKPSWTPPSGVFAPVWTLLYVAMGVAAWRVWRRQPSGVVASYAVQLVLNAAWSVLFFGLQNPLLGLVDITALWLVLASMLVLFAKRDRIAALLWLPYVAWVSFALALNASIWALNR